MEVPAEVLEAASELVAQYGPSLKHLGVLDGKEVFVFMFPAGDVGGFPFVYLYEKGKPVDQVNGFDALDIVCSFTE